MNIQEFFNYILDELYLKKLRQASFLNSAAELPSSKQKQIDEIRAILNSAKDEESILCELNNYVDNMPAETSGLLSRKERLKNLMSSALEIYSLKILPLLKTTEELEAKLANYQKELKETQDKLFTREQDIGVVDIGVVQDQLINCNKSLAISEDQKQALEKNKDNLEKDAQENASKLNQVLADLSNKDHYFTDILKGFSDELEKDILPKLRGETFIELPEDERQTNSLNLQEQLKRMREIITSVLDAINKYHQNCRESKSELSKKDKKLKNLKKTCSDNEELINRQDIELQELRNRNNQLMGVSVENSAVRARLNDCQRTEEKLNEKNKELEKKLVNKEAKIAFLEGENTRLKALQTQCDSLNYTVITHERAEKDCREQINVLRKKKSELEKQLENLLPLDRKLKETKAMLEESKKISAEKTKELNKAGSERGGLIAKCDQLSRENIELKRTVNQLKKDLKEDREELKKRVLPAVYDDSVKNYNELLKQTERLQLENAQYREREKHYALEDKTKSSSNSFPESPEKTIVTPASSVGVMGNSANLYPAATALPRENSETRLTQFAFSNEQI